MACDIRIAAVNVIDTLIIVVIHTCNAIELYARLQESPRPWMPASAGMTIVRPQCR